MCSTSTPTQLKITNSSPPKPPTSISTTHSAHSSRTITPGHCTLVDALKLISDAVKYCWELLDSDFLDGLAKSISERIKAGIGTGG